MRAGPSLAGGATPAAGGEEATPSPAADEADEADEEAASSVSLPADASSVDIEAAPLPAPAAEDSPAVTTDATDEGLLVNEAGGTTTTVEALLGAIALDDLLGVTMTTEEAASEASSLEEAVSETAPTAAEAVIAAAAAAAAERAAGSEDSEEEDFHDAEDEEDAASLNEMALNGASLTGADEDAMGFSDSEDEGEEPGAGAEDGRDVRPGGAAHGSRNPTERAAAATKITACVRRYAVRNLCSQSLIRDHLEKFKASSRFINSLQRKKMERDAALRRYNELRAGECTGIHPTRPLDL